MSGRGDSPTFPSCAGRAVSFSSVVVAGCALTVTIKVMNTFPVQRVMDQEALERQVAEMVNEPGDEVICPPFRRR